METPTPKYKLKEQLFYYYIGRGEVEIDCEKCDGLRSLELRDGGHVPCPYCHGVGRTRKNIEKIHKSELTVDRITISMESGGSNIRYMDYGTRGECNEKCAFNTLKELKDAVEKEEARLKEKQK
jgi:hypothetical protein